MPRFVVLIHASAQSGSSYGPRPPPAAENAESSKTSSGSPSRRKSSCSGIETKVAVLSLVEQEVSEVMSKWPSSANRNSPQIVDWFSGFVRGMAVGDALGLPREGLSPRRAVRLFGGAPLQHRFISGRGMVSDDTEHMWETALALIEHPDDASAFAKSLARRLRWWLLRLPAGVGLATARSLVKSWLGWPPDRSGVRSAGNGPAMRAGIIGLCLSRDETLMREFVRASTRLTHSDPRAESGAMMIALAAREIIRSAGTPVSIDAKAMLALCRGEANHPDWERALNAVAESLAAAESSSQFAERLGQQRGVSGYIVFTVAAVLFCWLRWPGEFRRPVEEIILLGGDTDTTAAILGGLAGAACGADQIPYEWSRYMAEIPRDEEWQGTLGRLLFGRFWLQHEYPEEYQASWNNLKSPPELRWMLALRNPFFLAVVLSHGFRRLLPPY